jgi:hypothetical protein
VNSDEAKTAYGLAPGARVIEDNALLVEHDVLLVAESDLKRILARTELDRYQHQYNARTAHAICKKLGVIWAFKRAVERCGNAFLPTEDATSGSIPRNASPAHFAAARGECQHARAKVLGRLGRVPRRDAPPLHPAPRTTPSKTLSQR